MTERPTTTPATLPKLDKKNINLFDFTILVFSISRRATESIIEDVTKDIPLATKKLDMAERILPVAHPQREKHVINFVNIKALISMAKELLKMIASERERYSANIPEYSTGLFAEYNRASVVRFVGLVNATCARMREIYPAVAAHPQLRILEGLQSHFECCESHEPVCDASD